MPAKQKLPLAPALWVAFTGLLVTIGILVFRACEISAVLGLHVSFCPARLDLSALDDEIARGEYLRQQISDIERRLEALPRCASTSRPAPEPPPPGRAAVIPPNSDLGVLEGCWRTTTPTIHLKGTDIRVIIRYCFGADGRTGNVLLRRSDGVTCEGPVTSRIDADLLMIDVPTQTCSNGGNLPPSKVVCRLDATRPTSCDIIDLIDGVPEPVEEQIRNEQLIRVED